MIIAGTGHRPDKLGGYTARTRLALGGLATEYLAKVRPDKVISGMALGWDQALAAAAVALDIPFVAAIPFDGQERRWPTESQQHYKWLRACADEVEILAQQPCDVPKAMQRRNEWMVDRADQIVALWDGSWGGTHNCITYARKKSVPVENLWWRWAVPADLRELIG